MNRAKTRSMIVRSQLAAVILLLLAGGAVAFSPFGSGVPEMKSKPASNGPTEAKAHIVPLDVGLAGDLVKIALEQPSEKPLPPPETKPTETQPPEPPKSVWEYIGGLIGPSSRKAVVTISGDQKVVSEGDAVSGAKVNAITADFIMVETDGKEERIDRKNRKERVAAAPQPGIPASGMAAMVKSGAAGKPPALGGMMSPPPPARKKADKGAEARDKQRMLYLEAVRASNGAVPEGDTLAKFGLSDFEPTQEELEQIMKQMKDPEGSGKFGDK